MQSYVDSQAWEIQVAAPGLERPDVCCWRLTADSYHLGPLHYARSMLPIVLTPLSLAPELLTDASSLLLWGIAPNKPHTTQGMLRLLQRKHHFFGGTRCQLLARFVSFLELIVLVWLLSVAHIACFASDQFDQSMSTDPSDVENRTLTCAYTDSAIAPEHKLVGAMMDAPGAHEMLNTVHDPAAACVSVTRSRSHVPWLRLSQSGCLRLNLSFSCWFMRASEWTQVFDRLQQVRSCRCNSAEQQRVPAPSAALRSQ